MKKYTRPLKHLSLALALGTLFIGGGSHALAAEPSQTTNPITAENVYESLTPAQRDKIAKNIVQEQPMPGSAAALQHRKDIGADNFYKSDQVKTQRVTFPNIYGMNVVGTLITPKNISSTQQLPAVVVGHPMGAVKEESSTLYATKLAEQGFATLAIDLNYWGESDGTKGREANSVAPDVYAEDFSAAVDYLGTRPFIDREKIGALGICGSGSFVISAAKIDPRIKAVATVSMYDMGAAARDGLNHGVDLDARKAMIAQAANARYDAFLGGKMQYTSGTDDKITPDMNNIQKEFYDFYRTERGQYIPKGKTLEETTHPTLISMTKFINFYPFNDMNLLDDRPKLFIAGEDAHSVEFSEEAYNLSGGEKELVLIPNTGHVDLYDGTNRIPWDKLFTFFHSNLDK